MVRWPNTARDMLAGIDAAEAQPNDDAVDLRLPLVIAARERDRLARLRLGLGGHAVDQPRRGDMAAALADMEFRRARGRRGRR